MMIRDEFYPALPNNIARIIGYNEGKNVGTIKAGICDGTIVVTWDGINPVPLTQDTIEGIDWDVPDFERLPDKKFRLCQYVFEHYKTSREYNTVAFNVTPVLEGTMPQEYWDRLAEWKAYQGIAP